MGVGFLTRSALKFSNTKGKRECQKCDTRPKVLSLGIRNNLIVTLSPCFHSVWFVYEHSHIISLSHCMITSQQPCEVGKKYSIHFTYKVNESTKDEETCLRSHK